MKLADMDRFYITSIIFYVLTLNKCKFYQCFVRVMGT